MSKCFSCNLFNGISGECEQKHLVKTGNLPLKNIVSIFVETTRRLTLNAQLTLKIIVSLHYIFVIGIACAIQLNVSLLHNSNLKLDLFAPLKFARTQTDKII